MTEKLFQFIWQQLRFNQRNLVTVAGEKITILDRGTLNTNQGPDFLNARVRINETTWAGHIELHIKEMDWEKHGHSSDPNFDNVILHVVYQADAQPRARKIPTLSLEGRISASIVNRHDQLTSTAESLPCRNLLTGINETVFSDCKVKMLKEKWELKSDRFLQSLQAGKFHFEEILWKKLAGNFGSPVNTQAFEMIAESIPWKVVQLVRHKAHALEALLLGQAGMVPAVSQDKYSAMLSREYAFMATKFKLAKPQAAPHFLRMRPANFPTIRLVQFATLYTHHSHLFAQVRDASGPEHLLALLEVKAGDYWDYHYRFGEEAAFIKKNLGEEMKRNILINTFLPFLYAYGKHVQSKERMERAEQWLMSLPAEVNRITRQFANTPFQLHHAFDSQALIFLRKHYCHEKRCLQCPVGATLLE